MSGDGMRRSRHAFSQHYDNMLYSKVHSFHMLSTKHHNVSPSRVSRSEWTMIRSNYRSLMAVKDTCLIVCFVKWARWVAFETRLEYK